MPKVLQQHQSNTTKDLCNKTALESELNDEKHDQTDQQVSYTIKKLLEDYRFLNDNNSQKEYFRRFRDQSELQRMIQLSIWEKEKLLKIIKTLDSYINVGNSYLAKMSFYKNQKCDNKRISIYNINDHRYLPTSIMDNKRRDLEPSKLVQQQTQGHQLKDLLNDKEKVLGARKKSLCYVESTLSKLHRLGKINNKFVFDKKNSLNKTAADQNSTVDLCYKTLNQNNGDHLRRSSTNEKNELSQDQTSGNNCQGLYSKIKSKKITERHNPILTDTPHENPQNEKPSKLMLYNLQMYFFLFTKKIQELP